MNVRLPVRRAGVKQFPTNTCQWHFSCQIVAFQFALWALLFSCALSCVSAVLLLSAVGRPFPCSYCFYQSLCMLFSDVGYFLFHCSPLLCPSKCLEEQYLLSCPMQCHLVFCSLLSSLLHWAYLETVLNVDVFRASEISLPASSQHKRNYIVEKCQFFIGDCIRIWALHRIISIASSCSSSCRFALSSDTVMYFVSRIPMGLMWLTRSGRFSPVHLLLVGATRISPYLYNQHWSNTLMCGNSLVGCREERNLYL